MPELTISLEIEFVPEKSLLAHKLYLQVFFFLKAPDKSVNGILRISKELETVASLAKALSFPQIPVRRDSVRFYAISIRIINSNFLS